MIGTAFVDCCWFLSLLLPGSRAVMWPTSMTFALVTMILDWSGSPSFWPAKVAYTLTVEPGVILPATPVAASIMMATSCCPGCRAGWSTIMSVCSREPPRSVVTAILPWICRRSVTAVSDSHRLGISIFLNWAAVRAV